jgi:N-acetylglutamate synthase-like GNAT family acetyltransferase
VIQSQEESLQIRSATPADASAIARLSGQLGYPVAVQSLTARLECLLASEKDALYVAAASKGQVVGWVHGAEQLLVESGARCEILGLVVDEDVRRGGIGRQLVEAIEQWALGRGLGEVSVRSAINRAESHPFYQQLGYERVKSQHVYRKRLVAAGAA